MCFMLVFKLLSALNPLFKKPSRQVSNPQEYVHRPGSTDNYLTNIALKPMESWPGNHIFQGTVIWNPSQFWTLKITFFALCFPPILLSSLMIFFFLPEDVVFVINLFGAVITEDTGLLSFDKLHNVQRVCLAWKTCLCVQWALCTDRKIRSTEKLARA